MTCDWKLVKGKLFAGIQLGEILSRKEAAPGAFQDYTAHLPRAALDRLDLPQEGPENRGVQAIELIRTIQDEKSNPINIFREDFDHVGGPA